MPNSEFIFVGWVFSSLVCFLSGLMVGVGGGLGEGLHQLWDGILMAWVASDRVGD